MHLCGGRPWHGGARTGRPGPCISQPNAVPGADLHFDKGKDLYKIIRERTKTGEPLYIPIPKDVAEKCWPHSATALRMSSGIDRRRTLPNTGTLGTWGSRFAEAFKAAGVHSDGHMISHRLRATFAVDLLAKGVPLEHVSKLLGHRSVTTTERHYAKWVKGRQDRLDSVVSASWSKKRKP